MLRTVLVLALALTASGNYSTGLGSGGGSGGGSAVVAAINCRSFGSTASGGGTLNIKYGDPVVCWATSSTVNGIQINVGGWVPEAFVSWNWDDDSLGTVSRGGITVDLGKGEGIVAAHAFLPSTFAETCNGGTNSQHVITGTVYARDAGTLANDGDSITVCVENPATTHSTPVAFCDDSDCSNDLGVPAGTVHGGNGTDLATILDYCDNNGTERVLLEGGVTFSTGTDVTISGANRCLIESYGTGKARMKFTSVAGTHSIIKNSTTPYVINNVEFAGVGDDNHGLIVPTSTDNGYFAILNSNVSTTAGEEFSNFTVANSAVTVVEAYWIKSIFDKSLTSASSTSTYLRCQYCAWVGGTLSASRSHILRLAQWNHVAIDAMDMSNLDYAHTADHLITLRHDCGSVASCTVFTNTGPAAITRNKFLANDTATVPIQFCKDGNGDGEPTQCWDVDVMHNISAWDTTTGVDFFYLLSGGTTTVGVLNSSSADKRFRFIGNMHDLSAQGSTVSRMVSVDQTNGTDDLAFIGNVLVSQISDPDPRQMVNGSSFIDVAKNNVCWTSNAGGSDCDMFQSFVESSDNVEVENATDPFDGTGGLPGTFASFVATDLRITSSNTTLKGLGVISTCPTDWLDGETIPQSSDQDAGNCVDDE